jgi:hypothetical protein
MYDKSFSYIRVWSLKMKSSVIPHPSRSLTIHPFKPVRRSPPTSRVIDGVSMSACLNMPIAWRCIMQEYGGKVFNQAIECLNQLASWRAILY